MISSFITFLGIVTFLVLDFLLQLFNLIVFFYLSKVIFHFAIYSVVFSIHNLIFNSFFPFFSFSLLRCQFFFIIFNLFLLPFLVLFQSLFILSYSFTSSKAIHFFLYICCYLFRFEFSPKLSFILFLFFSFSIPLPIFLILSFAPFSSLSIFIYPFL